MARADMENDTPGTAAHLSRRRMNLSTLLIFLLALAGLGVPMAQFEHARYQARQQETARMAGRVGDVLQERLDRGLSATYALAALVRQGSGRVEHFDELAWEMLRLYGGVSSLQLAPDAVVTQIVPLAGNERAIGHNLLADPDRRREASLTIETRRLTLAGPFKLVQGGMAVAGRNPVFLQDADGREVFWGFTIAVIDMQELLDVPAVKNLQQTGFRHALWRRHPDTGQPDVFARSDEAPLAAPLNHEVKVPNGSWTLSLEPESGWHNPLHLIAEVLAAVLLSAALAYGGRYLLWQQYALHRENERRRRSEALLEESQALARLGSWELDLVTDRLDWSREIFRIFEIDPGQFGASYEAFLSAIHPEDRDAVNRAYSDSLASRKPYEIVHRLLMADGRIKYVHERCETHYGEDGRPLRSVGTVQDITQLHHMEDALRESEARFRGVFANAGSGIVFSSAEGRLLEVNQAFCNMVGYDEAALLAMNFRDLTVRQDQLREQVLLDELLAGRSNSYRMEKRYRRRDGSETWADLTVTVLRNPDGSPGNFIALATDINERKRAEDALARYQSELENKVAQRILELSRAKEAAEAANLAKSLFLANMSHELRTPLNAILGFAQILERDEKLGQDEKDKVSTIHRSGRHLLSLINDVLEISRIEAGRLVVVKETLDLHQTLEALVEMVGVRAREKGLEMGLEVGADVPCFVRTDQGKLRQILLNLLGNAVKYTDAGFVRISVSVCPDKPGHLCFAVADSGIGIALDEQGRIFEAFYQTLEGARRGEGTGLGLALCHEYVHLLGGEISVESRPGQGSVFRVSLPVEPSLEQAAQPAVAGGVLGLAGEQQALRILVAEDQPDSRRLLEELLEQAGFQVCGAANGREAVARFRDWSPHFIWMDMRMPEMDGYDATRQIRALPGGAAVPIVALTASAFEKDRDAIRQAGCNDVLKKPFETGEIFALMARHLPIRYRRADAEQEVAPACPEDLERLAPDLGARLHEAAVTLDGEGVLAVADEIEREWPQLAAYLRESVKDYRYDELMARFPA